MSVFKEAKKKELEGKGYFYSRFKIIKDKKNILCSYLCISYGIRRSDKFQFFPIWNTSNNCKRALLFGVWKLYIEIAIYRKNSFNQRRKFFLRKLLWRFYQLVA